MTVFLIFLGLAIAAVSILYCRRVLRKINSQHAAEKTLLEDKIELIKALSSDDKKKWRKVIPNVMPDVLNDQFIVNAIKSNGFNPCSSDERELRNDRIFLESLPDWMKEQIKEIHSAACEKEAVGEWIRQYRYFVFSRNEEQKIIWRETISQFKDRRLKNHIVSKAIDMIAVLDQDDIAAEVHNLKQMLS